LDRGIFFQLSLKGLGNVGGHISNLLEQRILGYDDSYLD
jgi:hypothetical protein